MVDANLDTSQGINLFPKASYRVCGRAPMIECSSSGARGADAEMGNTDRMSLHIIREIDG